MSSDEATCSRQAPVPWQADTEPYEGPGPHYIRMLEAPGVTTDLAAVVGKRLPAYMTPPSPLGWGNYELVACLVAIRLGKKVGVATCHFDEPIGDSTRRWPFHEAIYEFTVREARTARDVRTVEVPGTLDAAHSCPSVAIDTGRTKVPSGLDDEILRDALQPLFADPVK